MLRSVRLSAPGLPRPASSDRAVAIFCGNITAAFRHPIEVEHRQRRWSARVDGTRRDVAYREAEKVAVFSDGTEDKRLPSFSRLPKVFGPPRDKDYA